MDTIKKLNVFICERNKTTQECINISNKWLKGKKAELEKYMGKEHHAYADLNYHCGYHVGYQRALFEVLEELKEILEEEL